MMWSFPTTLLLISSLSSVSAMTKYCQGVGSFDDDSPFDGLPLPDCPEKLKLSMLLYTRSNPSTGQLVTKSTIPEEFDGGKMTVFFVHGWMSDGLRWPTAAKNAILEKVDYNVIVAHWDSHEIAYPQSVSDTRSVGAEIGLVAANLIAHGNSAKSRLYCVGHSLGAHVCGHAGMTTKFGRITGLDPAGPVFLNRDSKVGLNPSSADLVDVIHTDGGIGFGSQRVLGHVDFYPNGGRSQRGCLLFRPTCNHVRAVGYYLESIANPCFKSQQVCTDENWLPDSCKASPSVIQSMGFDADKYNARGIFYLTTNKHSPYCMG